MKKALLSTTVLFIITHIFLANSNSVEPDEFLEHPAMNKDETITNFAIMFL